MNIPSSVVDPHNLLRVDTVADIEQLQGDTVGIFIRGLTDEKLDAVASRVPKLRHLVADGNNQVTDEGLVHLARLSNLEALDLEWSAVTDTGLRRIAAAARLRWIDLGFCTGVTSAGLAWLRQARPDLEVIGTAA